MSEACSTFVPAGPVRLRVLTHGDDGRDLVLLPGITSPAAVWTFVARPLVARGWRVHVLDLRGRGESDSAPASAYTLPDYAADAAATVERLGLTRPLVLGHSLGARIAARLAVDRPDLPGPLVLADPPLTGPGRPPYPLPLDFYLDGIRQARAGLTVEEARALEPTWSDEQVLDRARWLGTCDEDAIRATYRGFHEEDFLALWDALERPGLIYGAASPVVTADGAAELRARNPRAVVDAVPGAGHMIPWNDLDGFLAAFDRVAAALGSPGA